MKLLCHLFGHRYEDMAEYVRPMGRQTGFHLYYRKCRRCGARRVGGKALSAAVLAAAILLYVGPAQAAVYQLINGATATQSSIATAVQQGINQIVAPQSAVSGPLTAQAFVIWATNPGGGPSCTVQLLGSNDGITWVSYGSTIAASAQSGGSNAVAASGSGSTPFAYFAALVTAISGTNTKCFVSLSG